MASFYYDTDKLKRQFTEENVSNYGDFVAECFRSNNLYKDGWSESKVIDTQIEGIQYINNPYLKRRPYWAKRINVEI